MPRKNVTSQSFVLENPEKSFANGLSIYKLIWVFIIGSVIGCYMESAFIRVLFGNWTRRSGMLIGDFSQIYGLGAVLFVVLGHMMRNTSNLKIFLGIGMLGGLYEYLCGASQKAFLRSASWDYSSFPGSIGEHANLFVAMGWGLLGLMFFRCAWPHLSRLVERIPNIITIRSKQIQFGKSLTVLVAALLTLNLGLTCLAQWRAYQRQNHVPATNIITRWLDTAYPDELITEKFPNMTFVSDIDE